ncbi:MAG: hypothetical protein ACHQQR_11525, partial [Gemmatimonadales bacterium]
FREVTPMTRTSASFFTVWMVLTAASAFAQPDHERLIALARDGAVLATIDGDASSTAIGSALDLVLQRPDAHVRLTHNHPLGTALSGADLEQLTKPGVDVIEAVGSDGSRYEASRGPRFDREHFEQHQYRLADEEVTRQLRALASSSADRLGCDAHHAHLTAIALHKAGIIVYRAALSPARSSSYERNRAAFGRATEAAAARLKAER